MHTLGWICKASKIHPHTHKYSGKILTLTLQGLLQLGMQECPICQANLQEDRFCGQGLQEPSREKQEQWEHHCPNPLHHLSTIQLHHLISIPFFVDNRAIQNAAIKLFCWCSSRLREWVLHFLTYKSSSRSCKRSGWLFMCTQFQTQKHKYQDKSIWERERERENGWSGWRMVRKRTDPTYHTTLRALH